MIENFNSFLNENDSSTDLFKTRCFEKYLVTPHLVGDRTDMIMFLIFESSESSSYARRLLLDVTYNNGGIKLDSGFNKKLIEWEKDDLEDLYDFMDRWAKEISKNYEIFNDLKKNIEKEKSNMVPKKYGLK